jgi:hypothetical protein
MVTTTKTPDPLDALAAGVDLDAAEGSNDNGQAEAQALEAEQQAAQFAKLMAGLGVFTLKVAKALRQRAARNLPELLEHVTDADLQGPADALPAVLNKHLSKLSPLLGLYPEEAMLMLSLIPIGMGYVSALEAHSNADKKKIQAPAGAALPVLND